MVVAEENAEIAVRNRQIVAQFREGASTEELAESYGLNRDYLREVLRQQGCSPRAWHDEQKQARDAAIRADYTQGRTTQALGEKYGLMPETIQRIARGPRDWGALPPAVITDASVLRSQEREVGKYYREGWTVEALAEKYQLRVATVERIVEVLEGNLERGEETQARNRRLVAEYEAGATYEDLAEVFGLSKSYIAVLLREAGCQLVRAREAAKRARRNRQIVAGYEGGVTREALAIRFRLSEARIADILRAGGCQVKRRVVKRLRRDKRQEGVGGMEGLKTDSSENNQEGEFKGLKTFTEGEMIHIVVARGLLRRKLKSIKLPVYQLRYFQQQYPEENFSEALRKTIDWAIVANGKDFPNIRIQAKEALEGDTLEKPPEGFR